METRPIRILLIDDDEDQFVIAEKYLKRSRSGPYEIQWVDTFESALEAAGRKEHDLCLLDYQLGAHTGIELLEEMRRRGADLPVILLTGQGSYELDIDAMERGVSDFLDKNELTSVLLERSVRYTLENHRARMALKRMNDELEERVRERTAELNKSNQALENFARMVAQDLQTPIRTLERQVLDTLRRESVVGPAAGAAAHRLLGPVLHACQNIDLLVDSILDHARAGQDTAEREDIDLNTVVREVWARLADPGTTGTAALSLTELPTVSGNPRQVQGLMENLLDNALKYRGEQPPQIDVSALRRGNHWQIDVKDNGRGIAEWDSEEIFLMFNRISANHTCEGVGIGLAVCRKIVQHHGGRLWLDSEPGVGSTFHILLPAAEA